MSEVGFLLFEPDNLLTEQRVAIAIILPAAQVPLFYKSYMALLNLGKMALPPEHHKILAEVGRQLDENRLEGIKNMGDDYFV